MTDETQATPPAEAPATLPTPAAEAAGLQAATRRSRRAFIGLGLAGLAGLGSGAFHPFGALNANAVISDKKR